MANPNKAKGTRAETSVVNFLNEEDGVHAQRRALSGSNDCGDVEVVVDNGLHFALEVKTGKQTANPSRTQLEEWLRQAKVESENSGLPCHLVVVRYRRKLCDADVYSVGIPRQHWYLDEFRQFITD